MWCSDVVERRLVSALVIIPQKDPAVKPSKRLAVEVKPAGRRISGMQEKKERKKIPSAAVTPLFYGNSNVRSKKS